MRLSTLAKLLGGTLAPDEFRLEAAAELRAFARARQERGRAAPVRVVEDTDLLVTAPMIIAGLQLYVNGALSARELEYIGNVIELSERRVLSPEELDEVVAEFSSPELNGPFTTSRAREVLHALSLGT